MVSQDVDTIRVVLFFGLPPCMVNEYAPLP